VVPIPHHRVETVPGDVDEDSNLDLVWTHGRHEKCTGKDGGKESGERTDDNDR
jgi:hypothetical protein